ncbi:MAG: hypothetical protein Q7S99_14880 [Parvibaculum sp.]|nr:hypothetical protein [Parvibaculum sp.]|tara:strand:+ start:175 stop:474 length:300 start_codon:yes stop_codon:yes gene_type:complete
MSSKTAKALDEKVTEELDDLRKEIDRLTTALEEARVKFLEAAGESADGLLHAASDAAGEARDKAQEGWHELQTRIAEKPVQSTLIALGIGFILSRIILR